MIKQIYFDVGRVIFTRRTPDGDNIAKLLGFRKEDYQKVWQAVIDIQTEEENAMFWKIKTIEEEYKYLNEFHRKMCIYLNHPYDEEFITKLSDCRIKADFTINDGVIETLKILRDKYRLSIITNALPSRRHHELLMENLIENFDPIIISFEIGLHKPDKKIFEYALNQSPFEPFEIALIDDNLENVQSAKEVGFGQCIFFSNETHPDFKNTTNFRELLELLD
jgi:HAD superfamily hydrolase (TIGR01509 family)